MGITEYKEQRAVYRILSGNRYTGVLMVHCEKEELLHPGLFNPLQPETHLAARPPEAETQSIRDQIHFASESGFGGTLHICHISVPESLSIIEEARYNAPFTITCGITPHHALLSTDDMKEKEGLFLKVNPPLRSPGMQKEMYRALLEKRITFIESDHAPHTRSEKLTTFPSGIPVLQFYNKFTEILKNSGMKKIDRDDLTFNNILRTFSLSKDLFAPNSALQTISGDEYGFDPFISIKERYKL